MKGDHGGSFFEIWTNSNPIQKIIMSDEESDASEAPMSSKQMKKQFKEMQDMVNKLMAAQANSGLAPKVRPASKEKTKRETKRETV